MAPTLGGSEDEVHTHGYRCHSTDPATTLHFYIACLSFCWALLHVSGMLLCWAFTFDNEVGYDENLHISDVGQMS
jgi:hypothetical protein